MADPAVGVCFDDNRSCAVANPADDVLHRKRDRLDIVARDGDVLEAVAGRAARKRNRILVLGGRELGVVVVLTEEDDREPPERRQVERLVERPLTDGALAEEADHDGAVGTQLRGHAGAGSDRQPGADDPVGAEDPELGIGDVHRAAAPSTGAGVAAQELGKHRRRVEPLRQDMPVAAVG